jgi:phytanoyl-CoA hydroxylase
MSNALSGALTEQQRLQYRDQGYLIIESLLAPEECDELNQRALDFLAGRIAAGEGNRAYMEPEAVEKGWVSDEQPDPRFLFKIGHRMHMTDPVFRYYAMHERIADILNDLIGPDIKCVQSMYIDKPGNIGVGQPYHQDSYYLKTVPDTVIGVWIACDDVDEANGCLHIIPGSHREAILPHETPVNPKQRKYFLEVHAARGRKEIACRLPKGGAVFFPGTMLHRSGDNHTSDRQRRAYVLHYASAKSRPQKETEVRNPHLLVRGRQYPGCL